MVTRSAGRFASTVDRDGRVREREVAFLGFTLSCGRAFGGRPRRFFFGGSSAGSGAMSSWISSMSMSDSLSYGMRPARSTMLSVSGEEARSRSARLNCVGPDEPGVGRIASNTSSSSVSLRDCFLGLVTDFRALRELLALVTFTTSLVATSGILIVAVDEFSLDFAATRQAW